MRGKHLPLSNVRMAKPGSPPRMRGKLEDRREGFATDRITPAHAGKTALTAQGMRPWTDHPRACGENLSRWLKALGYQGSPPRMRGKPLGWFTSQDYTGITPAHAGKTRKRQGMFMPKEDHPRACGENCAVLRTFYRTFGSPPRMRGKPTRPASTEGANRITPAHAGKTVKLLL